MIVEMKLIPQDASIRSRQTFKKQPPSDGSGLEYPPDGVEPARDQRPVVLLHGTLVNKDGIASYRDFALRSGHPVSHRTYGSIKNGDRIEDSTELASKEVNRSRAEIATKNVQRFAEMTDDQLQEAFQLDGGLYGSYDSDVEVIKGRLADFNQRVAQTLDQKPEKIESGLSGQLKKLESGFVDTLSQDGLSEQKASGVAREIMETIAPKAVVIGHSAGGYIAHTLALNPELTPDQDKFTYDGGNGVGEVLVLSAPIGGGLPKPAPPGIAELPFYNYENTFLRPVENLPVSKLMLKNPLVESTYNTTKGLLRAAARLQFMMITQMTSPIVYAARPGNRQVEEGSEFFETYIKDKPIPEGVSIIGFTSPHDRLSQEERSRLVTEQPNGHTLSVDLGVTEEDLKRERPTWAHVIMAEKPDSFKAQFQVYLQNDAEAVGRILHRDNDDGVRYEALQMVEQSIGQAPETLTPRLRRSLEKVAAEAMPFRDAPSAVASSILSRHSA